MHARKMNLKELAIDQQWTLFLDRDGVINKKIENDYVKSWVEFEFIDGAIDAISILSKKFSKIIVVTNQQGIGKRLYRTEDLELIHKNMLYEISYHGGRIDRVYFSPHLAGDAHPARKPGIGMALQAQKDYPGIDFSKSIIAGDSISDMQFGRAAGMVTVLIADPNNQQTDLVDLSYHSLLEFAIALA
jgi:histidinol-phosphate phosphatase family protein